MRITLNPNPRCYKTFDRNFLGKMLGEKAHRQVLEGSREIVERIGRLILKAFEARTEALSIVISPKLLQNRVLLFKLSRALAKTQTDYFNGQCEIINKAFEIMHCRETASEMTAEFKLVDGRDIAVSIRARVNGKPVRINDFIIDSQHEERIGKLAPNFSENSLIEKLIGPEGIFPTDI